MKKILKWIGITVVALTILAFCAFLYFIPPFTTASPETFIKPEADAPPSLDHIKDPVQHKLAERGKYIVTHSGCVGCHIPGGDNGPKYDEYLAGGTKLEHRSYGRVVARNITPDPETGIGKRTDAEVMRVLRSGVLTDGRIIDPFMMPWADWSNWTDEDRYAVVVYLRNIKPIWHRIPDIEPSSAGYEAAYIRDYGIHDKK